LKSAYGVIIYFSSIAIIFGTFGSCCLCRPFSSFRCFAVIYGLVMLLLWIVFTAIGLTITAFAASAPNLV